MFKSDTWELWPGTVHLYLEIWEDADVRDIHWRRSADGTIEVYV